MDNINCQNCVWSGEDIDGRLICYNERVFRKVDREFSCGEGERKDARSV